MLNDPRYKLAISHDAGDEGFEYQHMLEELAREEGVELLFIGDRVSEVRQLDRYGRKMYTLWDLYPHADLVTYPSIYEGFGNALLEAFYFKKTDRDQPLFHFCRRYRAARIPTGGHQRIRDEGDGKLRKPHHGG